MASNQTSEAPGEPVVQRFSVRLPRTTENAAKKYAVMKFTGTGNIDFSTCGSARLERENNYKEFKSANDLDMMPKSGVGSQFGLEQRELARRKKFGMRIRKYNINDQPWLLKMGNGKQQRKFKGIREAGVMENSAYYIFTQCADGAFEAFNIDDWYHFTPQAKYKFLNAEEAEEEFDRRDKTLNYFSIMLQKRIRNDEEGAADADDAAAEKGKKKKSSKDKSLTLTEFDEWEEMSDGGDDEGSDAEPHDDDQEGKPKKGDKSKKTKKKKNDEDDDDEAVEENDEQDEGQEVDYIEGSSSDSEGMYDEGDRREDSEKYEEKGVEAEDGLKKLLGNSDDEDEDDEEKKDDEDEDDELKTKDDKVVKASDSEESESDSDSDIDNMDLSVSADSKKQLGSGSGGEKNDQGGGTSGGSTSGGAIKSATNSPAKKRKIETPVLAATGSGKKPAKEPSSSSHTSTSGGEGITEAVVKRYLQRKPMTMAELLQKIRKNRSMPLSKDQLLSSVAKIITRLNPDKSKIKDKLYFSVKKDVL